MSQEVSNALELLAGKTIRDRTEGMRQLQDLLKRDSNVNNIDPKGDGKAWLYIFQKAFPLVLDERDKYLKVSADKTSKRSGADALNRLEKAAGFVRWLTERSVTHLNRRVIKPLIAHLAQTIIYNGSVFTPVALSYVKALGTIIGFRPHLDYLDPDTWSHLLALSFAVVLNDRLSHKVSLEDIGSQEDQDTNASDAEVETVVSPAKKRRRIMSPPATLPTSSSSGSLSKSARPARLDQIECVALIRVLLAHPNASFMITSIPGASRAILHSFERYFVEHPAEGTAHQDAIWALNSVLVHLELNRSREVIALGARLWSPLLALWSGRVRPVKEGLVLAFTILMPLMMENETPQFSRSEPLARLSAALDGESENRSGLDGLSLDVLRLRLAHPEDTCGAFEAVSFKYGADFGPSHALSWVALQLQADCLAKSLSLAGSAIGTPRSEGKGRDSNLVQSLLSLIRSAHSTRNYRLQVMLFLIERHWKGLPTAIQSDICATLSTFLSQDDHISASWAFICCAAIACADDISEPSSTSAVTEEIAIFWNHAVRRIGVALECRAACHAAVAIARSGHLDSHTLYKDVEGFISDLQVQGPVFPHDSVCAFLVECLRFASRDVVLFRKQLEDKVLAWLFETWSLSEAVRSSARNRIDTHSPADVLELLQVSCGLTRCILPLPFTLLPDCAITEIVIDRQRTELIRNYLIYARLPKFNHNDPKCSPNTTIPILNAIKTEEGANLMAPNDRARKASAFLLKSLRSLLDKWDSAKDTTTMSREAARRAVDLICLALWFEASLEADGIRPNAQVIGVACALVRKTTPCLSTSQWTLEERAAALLAYDTIVDDGEQEVDHTPWQAILDPDVGTGIKRRALARMVHRDKSTTKEYQMLRRRLIQGIWRWPEIQLAFMDLVAFLRRAIHDIRPTMPGEGNASTSQVDVDGFSEIRTSGTEPTARAADNWTATRTSQALISFGTRFLTATIMFRSPKLEPTKDHEILEFLQSCDGLAFFSLAPEVFECVRRGYLHIGTSDLESMLDHLGELLKSYGHPRCEKMQLILLSFLECIMPIWIKPDDIDKDCSVQARVLLHWFSEMLVTQKIHSWKSRDRLTVLMGKYLVLDPQQSVWSVSSSDESDTVSSEYLPGTMLVNLGSDCDIRVRFRAAEGTADVFRSLKHTDTNLFAFYQDIRQQLCITIDDFEGMLTRFIALANVMVVSSSVRRGPYWHLLETAYHSTLYSDHMASVLVAVSDRMGLTSLSQLFEAYASQIAYSTYLAKKEITQIPSRILGYTSNTKRVEESFKFVGPTLLLSGGLQNPTSHGVQQFQSLCKSIGIPESDGLRLCFHDVIGLTVVVYHEENLKDDTPTLLPEATRSLQDLLLSRTAEACRSDELPQDYLARVAPMIVASIVRTINGAPDEDILRAFRDLGKASAAKDFEAFQYYWGDEDFPVHDPMLPAFSPQVVIASLFWFLENQSSLFLESHLAYHVAHQLFVSISKSPLVNEQLRLLRSLSIVIASLKHFRKEWILLRTLIHGYSLLLTQPDLARMAQSALDWCLTFIPKHISAITSGTPRLEVLGRMGRIAYDYTRESDAFMRRLGHKLMDWVEGVTARLEKEAAKSEESQKLQPEILNVLALWPRELRYPELASRAEELDSDNMSYILQHYASNASKFRTVHRLLSIAHSDEGRISTFAKADFWRLKSCIPSGDQLQNEDATAFTALLFANKGNIASLTSGRHDAHSIDALHRVQALKNRQDLTSPLSAILVALFDLVYSEDPSKVFTAYQTIGRLSSLDIDGTNFPGTPSTSRSVQQERTFYTRHAETPLVTEPRSIEELATAEDIKTASSDHSVWVRTMGSYFCALLSSVDGQGYFSQLMDIINLDEELAKQLLPVLIHVILQHEESQIGVVKFENDDSSARAHLSAYFTKLLMQKSTPMAIIDCVIQIVLHLRNFHPQLSTEARDWLAYNHWLDIDHRLLSEGALRCGAYTTAVLFLELYKDREHDFSDANITRSTEEMLYDIYAHIDEPDGFYAIQGDDTQRHLIRSFLHEGRWDKAFQFLGATFESPSTSASSVPGILSSLQSFGFDNLAMTMINGVQNAQVSSEDNRYSLGWRTETWDLPVSAGNVPSGSSLYYALRAVHQERDPATVELRLLEARRSELERLRKLGLEDMSQIRQSTRALMCIGEVHKFLQTSRSKRSAEGDAFTQLSTDFEFDDYECLVATRLSLLRANIHKNRALQIGNVDSQDTQLLLKDEQELLVRLAQAARDSQKSQIALNAITRASNGAPLNESNYAQEYASVMWAQQQQTTAIGFLGKFLEQALDKRGRPLKETVPTAQLLSLMGTWTSDARLEQPMNIREKYFGRAEKLLKDLHHHPSHAIVYHRYAKFAEEQYNSTLRSTSDIERLKARMDRKKNELTQIGESLRSLVGNPQLTHQQRKSQALLKSDTDQFDGHVKSQRVFLEQAIEMYARCLIADDSQNNETIIRLCSLWFAHFSDAALNSSVLQSALKNIPSHKFVFLAHQISARLSSSEDPGHKNVRSLMTRLCRDHPFHALYQVYALSSARPSTAAASTSRRQSRPAAADPQSQNGRDEAARSILDQLRLDPRVGKRVAQFIQLCDACLQWAKYSLRSNKALKDSKVKLVPTHLELAKLKDLNVPVSTAYTPIDLSCRYEDSTIVRVQRYGSKFSTAGGINLPKISDCLGDDGERYKQLFKGEGEDDLRQDAVMEQVFELVNILLQRDRASKKRNLSVRTYKVIPLASQAGMLEFVTNTTPLGSWLLNAHRKYAPNDWQPQKCSENLKKARATNKPQVLTTAFMEIREHFKPVMRHFFTEAHKLPTAWFDMRLNYQRSVATTSIVGHILGLGDRHLSNILIHNITGEVVHIDLGIAFDQGRLLPIPETVPFRLTADMVDGLGSSGTEGVYRRCAQETLRVLREQASVIKTILEVFNHDPLHSWSAAPVKIKHIQGSNSDTHLEGLGLDSAEAEAADRALSSVSRKLDTSMSVEYTVNDLIATATDPGNLSQIFVGWNPHV